MNDFLKDVIKETGNEYAGIVSEGVEAGDVEPIAVNPINVNGGLNIKGGNLKIL